MDAHFGQYAKYVPTDRRGNLLFRQWLLKRCREEPEYRAAVKEMCKRDIVFSINATIYQFNPAEFGHEDGPFICWDYQIEAIQTLLWCITHRKDVVIEKSREMGASWLCLIIAEWLWRYHRSKHSLMISRSAEAVDDDSQDSLFWKLDYIHRFTPKWLLPRSMKRKSMFFGNDDLNSSITGQASTGKAGVGGRGAIMFIDEFTKIREDVEVLNNTADTSQCRIFNATHEGPGTAFHGLTHPKPGMPAMKKIVMHWSQHPRKKPGLYRYNPNSPAPDKIDRLDPDYRYPDGYNFVRDGTPSGGPFPGVRSPWYDHECAARGRTRVGIAQNLDIDPAGSVSLFFDPVMIRNLVHEFARPAYWEGDIHADPDTGKPIGLVKKEKGPLRLWTHLDSQGKPPRIRCGAGADLSTGSGSTNSCLALIARTGELVLEYTTPFLRPDEFATKAFAICQLFVDSDFVPPLIAWEQQGPGVHFGKRMIELGYRRVYYKRNEAEQDAPPSDVPGWYPSVDNKRLLLDEFAAALSNRDATIRSEEALLECLFFKHTGRTVEHDGDGMDDDPSGAKANHGDRCIAVALAWKMVRELGIVTVSGLRKVSEPIVPNSLAGRRKMREDQLREWEEA